MSQHFQHCKRRTERLFRWVAFFAFLLFATVVVSWIAQLKGYYDVRMLLGL
jgi:hypothetical protein